MAKEGLAALLNLGPTSARWLEDAGITSYDDLERLGSVEAYLLVKETQPKASLNLLYALEAALLGTRWDLLPPEVRANLRRRADAAEGPAAR